MAHGIVKLWPGKSEEQNKKLIVTIAKNESGLRAASDPQQRIPQPVPKYNAFPRECAGLLIA
jgi:hypothetical protein